MLRLFLPEVVLPREREVPLLLLELLLEPVLLLLVPVLLELLDGTLPPYAEDCDKCVSGVFEFVLLLSLSLL